MTDTLVVAVDPIENFLVDFETRTPNYFDARLGWLKHSTCRPQSVSTKKRPGLAFSLLKTVLRVLRSWFLFLRILWNLENMTNTLIVAVGPIENFLVDFETRNPNYFDTRLGRLKHSTCRPRSVSTKKRLPPPCVFTSKNCSTCATSWFLFLRILWNLENMTNTLIVAEGPIENFLVDFETRNPNYFDTMLGRLKHSTCRPRSVSI